MRSETNHSLNPNLNSEVQKPAGELRSLAKALCLDVNLGFDSCLAHILGAGDERSNEEAVRTWVRNQLPELTGLARHQLLENLKSRLHRRLILWELER